MRCRDVAGKVDGEVHGLQLILQFFIDTFLQRSLDAVIGAEQSGHKEFSRVYKSDCNDNKKV